MIAINHLWHFYSPFLGVLHTQSLSIEYPEMTVDFMQFSLPLALDSTDLLCVYSLWMRSKMLSEGSSRSKLPQALPGFQFSLPKFQNPDQGNVSTTPRPFQVKLFLFWKYSPCKINIDKILDMNVGGGYECRPCWRMHKESFNLIA